MEVFVMEISSGNLLKINSNMYLRKVINTSYDVAELCQHSFSSCEDTLCVFFPFFNLLTQLCQKKQHLALLNWSRLQKDENIHVNLNLCWGKGLVFCN